MEQIAEIRFDSVDSTNAYAKSHSGEFDPGKITCIIADHQTAGYGQKQRRWESPRGKNIYATFVFRLTLPTLHLSCLSHILCLSLAQVLIRENFDPKIKWPNDLLLDGKKMAGVLCELQTSRNDIDVYIGIGVNINMSHEELKAIDQPATSLYAETGRIWDRDSLLKKLEKQFAKNLESFRQKGFSPFHSEYENLLAYRGQTIHCSDTEGEWVGICHSITSDGRLNLYLSNHEMRTLNLSQ